MGHSRQEYCCGLSFPILGDLPHPGIESATSELAGRFFTTAPPGKHTEDIYDLENTLYAIKMIGICHYVLFGCPVVSDSATPWTAACQNYMSL